MPPGKTSKAQQKCPGQGHAGQWPGSCWQHGVCKGRSCQPENKGVLKRRPSPGSCFRKICLGEETPGIGHIPQAATAADDNWLGLDSGIPASPGEVSTVSSWQIGPSWNPEAVSPYSALETPVPLQSPA